MSKQYKTGKIYVIKSPHTDKCYIGGTFNSLAKRFYQHKCTYKAYEREKEKAGYTSSYEIIKYDDCYIELLEEFDKSLTKFELICEEEKYIQNTPNCVNIKLIKKEVKIPPKQNPEYAKQYYNDHKDKIKAQLKVSQQKQHVRELLKKLNDGHKFERYPYSRIEKYGLKQDESGKWVQGE